MPTETDKLRQIIVVIVGFKINQENSVLYKKIYLPNDHELGAIINKAFHDKQCDFLSLRAIEKVRT